MCVPTESFNTKEREKTNNALEKIAEVRFLYSCNLRITSYLHQIKKVF